MASSCIMLLLLSNLHLHQSQPTLLHLTHNPYIILYYMIFLLYLFFYIFYTAIYWRVWFWEMMNSKIKCLRFVGYTILSYHIQHWEILIINSIILILSWHVPFQYNLNCLKQRNTNCRSTNDKRNLIQGEEPTWRERKIGGECFSTWGFLAYMKGLKVITQVHLKKLILCYVGTENKFCLCNLILKVMDHGCNLKNRDILSMWLRCNSWKN